MWRWTFLWQTMFPLLLNLGKSWFRHRRSWGLTRSGLWLGTEVFLFSETLQGLGGCGVWLLRQKGKIRVMKQIFRWKSKLSEINNNSAWAKQGTNLDQDSRIDLGLSCSCKLFSVLKSCSIKQWFKLCYGELAKSWATLVSSLVA